MEGRVNSQPLYLCSGYYLYVPDELSYGLDTTIFSVFRYQEEMASLHGIVYPCLNFRWYGQNHESLSSLFQCQLGRKYRVPYARVNKCETSQDSQLKTRVLDGISLEVIYSNPQWSSACLVSHLVVPIDGWKASHKCLDHGIVAPLQWQWFRSFALSRVRLRETPMIFNWHQGININLLYSQKRLVKIPIKAFSSATSMALGLVVGALLDPLQPGFKPLTHHYFVAKFLLLVHHTPSSEPHD
ncbi:hypothetical protein VNO77_26881 [Canavalia gladiata]|uniref:Uncharacterized protein n=1 Tax=Canavalia gladiata TaxID=3824 RepID=A0AAN9KWT1_CANGL